MSTTNSTIPTCDVPGCGKPAKSLSLDVVEVFPIEGDIDHWRRFKAGEKKIRCADHLDFESYHPRIEPVVTPS